MPSYLSGAADKRTSEGPQLCVAVPGLSRDLSLSADNCFQSSSFCPCSKARSTSSCGQGKEKEGLQVDRENLNQPEQCSLSLCLWEPLGKLICFGLACQSVANIQFPCGFGWEAEDRILGEHY